ncbi:hypothetical protein C0993_012258 [Termitomyces sp. T159_Od127]|nr:hypothetical protein C0993_012258 [Termitomyces sp. T159_Od127]
MPHALFLGSSLAARDRVSLTAPALAPAPRLPGTPPARKLKARITEFLAPLFRVTRAERAAAAKDYRTRHGARENNPLSFVRAHLVHSVVDVVASLLALAVPINSAILILSATVLHDPAETTEAPVGLFDAYALIAQHLGHGAATVFALALLCAGQTSSVTATLSGQIVAEGFIEWRVSPFLRRLVTRLISLVPSVAVATAVGRSGINTLLVASQVTLSVVLPFIAFPLIYLTSSKVVMHVRKPDADEAMPMAEKVEGAAVASDDMIDLSNGWLLSGVAYLIWAVVLVANGYAIVSLAMQNQSM